MLNCRWGRGIMGRRARHRCGSRTAQRLSTLQPDREADLGQFGRLSVQQDARIHSRGTYIPYRTPMVSAPSVRFRREQRQWHLAQLETI